MKSGFIQASHAGRNHTSEAQTETGAIIVAIGVIVGIAAAGNIRQDFRINVLIFVVAGHIVGGYADFVNHTIDFLIIYRNYLVA